MEENQLSMNLTAVCKAQLAASFLSCTRPKFKITHKFLSSQKAAGSEGGIKKIMILLQMQTEMCL